MKPENNPYNIVRMFEDEIANYTGAPYAVSCDSCTNAIFLCLEWYKRQAWSKYPLRNANEKWEDVIIPRHTYLSVPQSILHAGFQPVLEDIEWCGEYQLKPLPIWDSAKRFTSGMYRPGQMQCLSFHIKKHLKLGKGGMILTDDPEAVKWLKKARYEGRTESYSSNETDVEFLGWNMYMEPTIAAKGLTLMQAFPKDNPDLPENPPYKELDKYSIFKNLKLIIADEKINK